MQPTARWPTPSWRDTPAVGHCELAVLTFAHAIIVGVRNALLLLSR